MRTRSHVSGIVPPVLPSPAAATAAAEAGIQPQAQGAPIVTQSHMEELPSTDDNVEVYWPLDKKYYPGTISAVRAFGRLRPTSRLYTVT